MAVKKNILNNIIIDVFNLDATVKNKWLVRLKNNL